MLPPVRSQLQRYFLDRLYIRRHVITAKPITAGGPSREVAVLVMQSNAQPVDLQLSYILQLSSLRQPLAAFGKRLQIVEIIGIVQRHQRHGVNEWRQAVGLAADALGR